MRDAKYSKTATRPLSCTIAVMLLAGCVTGRTASGTALQAGEQATIAGRVVAIDMTPWTYDGNAVVQVATEVHGIVQVQLPARWNLCAAPPVAADMLAIGDEVRASGTAGRDGALVVCERATHYLVEDE